MSTPASHPREDEATAYVFGMMDVGERMAFVNAMNADASLRALVDELHQTSAAMALDAVQSAPPAAVRDRVLENIKAIPQDGARKTLMTADATSTKGAQAWIGWAAAACFAMLSVFFWMVFEHSLRSSKDELAAKERQLAGLQKLFGESEIGAKRLQVTLAEINAATALLKQSLAKSEAANQTLQQQIADNTKAAEALKQELAKVIKANDTAQTQIALLQSSVKDFEQGVAVVVWNSVKQEGILKLEKMPPIQTGKDYNLWVIDSTQKTPVNAGIVRVDAEGFAKVEFKPTLAIQQAEKFALSVEKEGGAPAGEGPAGPVVLLGQ
jgi:anti-sigma-K factor RskA